MAADPGASTSDGDIIPPQLGVSGQEQQVSAEEFEDGFGENLQRALDLDTWKSGEDLGEVYGRIAEEVRQAEEQEQIVRKTIRSEVFPRLSRYPGAPKGAGVYHADIDGLKKVHNGLLFNGGVEACDGIQQIHDSLPLTIFQIGISLVSYLGEQGAWSHRLFRKDLRFTGGDTTEQVMRLLERREERSESARESLSELVRRGITTHAERAILLERSTSTWRMGHGNPAPYELITGSGSMDLMIESTKVLRRLIEDQQKFLFVSNAPNDRLLLAIGDALQPLEYAVVRTLKTTIEKTIENGHYGTKVSSQPLWDGQRVTPEQWIKKFRDEVATQVVTGVFKASLLAPPQVFYAHVDHADVAAHIALADSVLQEHRGFPMLIDLASNVCRSVFGEETLTGPVTTAYSDLGIAREGTSGSRRI